MPYRTAITDPFDAEAAIERRVRELALYLVRHEPRTEYGKNRGRAVGRLYTRNSDRCLAIVSADVLREAEALVEAFGDEAESAGRKNPRERTACHEAGHALVTLLLGGTVEEVTIQAKDGGNARAVCHFPGRLSDPDHRLRRALSLAAGAAAEGVVFGDHGWGCALARTPDELATATQPEEWFSGALHDNTDASRLALIARTFGLTSAETIQAAAETWIGTAARLIAEHRGYLFDLIDALLEHRTLNAAAVAACFEGPAPGAPFGPSVNPHNLGLPDYRDAFAESIDYLAQHVETCLKTAA